MNLILALTGQITSEPNHNSRPISFYSNATFDHSLIEMPAGFDAANYNVGSARVPRQDELIAEMLGFAPQREENRREIERENLILIGENQIIRMERGSGRKEKMVVAA